MQQAHIYNQLVRFYNRSRNKLSRLTTQGINLRKQGILKNALCNCIKYTICYHLYPQFVNGLFASQTGGQRFDPFRPVV